MVTVRNGAPWFASGELFTASQLSIDDEQALKAQGEPTVGGMLTPCAQASVIACCVEAFG